MSSTVILDEFVNFMDLEWCPLDLNLMVDIKKINFGNNLYLYFNFFKMQFYMSFLFYPLIFIISSPLSLYLNSNPTSTPAP